MHIPVEQIQYFLSSLQSISYLIHKAYVMCHDTLLIQGDKIGLVDLSHSPTIQCSYRYIFFFIYTYTLYLQLTSTNTSGHLYIHTYYVTNNNSRIILQYYITNLEVLSLSQIDYFQYIKTYKLSAMLYMYILYEHE